jgi:ATP-dependent Clp endopeptidase proteolytic subunit ClpP
MGPYNLSAPSASNPPNPLKDAQTRKIEAEAEKAEAEAQRALAEARKTQLEAEVQEVARDVANWDRRKWLCGDEHHRTFHFTAPVNEKSVSTCMGALSLWDRLDPECDMAVIFSSPGGGLVEGFALFDSITMLRRKGHRIETGAIGMAASMAGILLQAGDVRWMSRETWLLIHEASFVAAGKLSEVEDTAAWVKRVSSRILDLFAVRASEKTGRSQNYVRNLIKQNWKRKDWWISSDEALRYGFVDEIR